MAGRQRRMGHRDEKRGSGIETYQRLVGLVDLVRTLLLASLEQLGTHLAQAALDQVDKPESLLPLRERECLRELLLLLGLHTGRRAPLSLEHRLTLGLIGLPGFLRLNGVDALLDHDAQAALGALGLERRR